MIGRRGLTLLVAVTAVAAGAAWLVSGGPGSADDGGRDQPFLPRLAERINDVAAVTVEGQDERFTVRREGEGWVVAEKDGYPAAFGTVKGTLVALSMLRKVEPKTSNPDLYGRLGVLDPDAPGSDATRVTATAADGGVLADLIVGHDGATRGTHYVREAGQGRSWEVRGELSVDPRAVGWLETSIVELPAARVKSAIVTHADGEVVAVAKQTAEDVAWALADVPEGREPAYEGVGRSLAGALERLAFDDVAAGASRPVPDAEAAATVFETFDGLRVTVRTGREAAPGAADGADAADDATPPVWAALDVEILPDAGDEVRAEGEALRARTGPWTYALSAYAATSLRKRMDAMTREATPAAVPEAEPVPAQGTDDVPTEEVHSSDDEAGSAAPDGHDHGEAPDDATDDATDDAPRR